MGVCCIIFDIDGMLFEFILNLLNIEKNKILRICFPIFHVFFAIYAISNTTNKNWQNLRGGGGEGCSKLFFLNQFFLISFRGLCKLVLKQILKNSGRGVMLF